MCSMTLDRGDCVFIKNKSCYTYICNKTFKVEYLN